MAARFARAAAALARSRSSTATRGVAAGAASLALAVAAPPWRGAPGPGRGAAWCEPSGRAPAVAAEAPVALVTGSSSGIGRAIAERLAAEGYRVVVNSSASVAAGEALAAALPGAAYIRGDCSTAEGCGALVEAAVDKFGRLDVLVCNAGIGKVIPHDRLDLIDDEYLHKTFALNCFGPLWLSRAAISHLQKAEDGCIVMISSAAGSRPMGSSVPYSMTRAAMNHLTRLLAKSFGPVRVNAVAPGLIKTRITEGAEWDAAHAVVAERVPLRRVGEPEDMVEAVLCCLRAKYMTGQIIGVDGGATLVF